MRRIGKILLLAPPILALLIVGGEFFLRWLDHYTNLYEQTSVLVYPREEKPRPPYPTLDPQPTDPCRPLRSRLPDRYAPRFPHPGFYDGPAPFPDPDSETQTVFVIGSSIAFAEYVMYPDSFTGILAERLSAERPTEMFNTSSMGVKSRQLAWMVKRVIDCYHPDLIILFPGNNEWIYYPTSRFTPLIETLHQTFGRYYLYRYLVAVARSLQSEDEKRLFLMNGPNTKNSNPDLFCEIDRSFSDPRGYDLATWQKDKKNYLASFRHNIEQAVLYAQAHKTPIVLCNIPHLIRMCPNFYEHQSLTAGVADRKTRRQVRKLFDKGLRDLREQRHKDALEKMVQAIRLAPHSPLPEYFAGLASNNMGQLAEAVEHFTAAREKTAGTQAAPESVNQILEDLAKQHDVPLVDLHAALLRNADHPLAMQRMFLDVLHPSPNGQVVMADAIYPTIQPLLNRKNVD